MTPVLPPPSPELTHLAQIIQLAVAPVFLLAGIGAFLNVCAGRLARIVDRARRLEPRILDSRGEEHDRLIAEVRMLDRRISVVNRAIFASVLAAVLISLVVILLFAAFLSACPPVLPEIDAGPTIADGRWGYYAVNYYSLMQWDGAGAIPTTQRKQLENLVNGAHATGRHIRIFSNPDTAGYWTAAREAHVDFVNTDKLSELAAAFAP